MLTHINLSFMCSIRRLRGRSAQIQSIDQVPAHHETAAYGFGRRSAEFHMLPGGHLNLRQPEWLRKFSERLFTSQDREGR